MWYEWLQKIENDFVKVNGEQKTMYRCSEKHFFKVKKQREMKIYTKIKDRNDILLQA